MNTGLHMAAKKDFSALTSSVGQTANLKENKGAVDGVKQKLIHRMPVAYEERFKALKQDGKTSLLFSAFILEAIREKLERDESK
jgi:hypothetical protein